MLPLTLWSTLLLSLSSLTAAQQTFFPASIPLSVRSPYLQIWLPAVNGSTPLPQSWPYFFGQQSIIGWLGFIRVDGVAFSFLGASAVSTATVTNIEVTPTRSLFVMTAGPLNVTVTFLSPIEPDDWVKQSLPFSYVAVEFTATDGKAHDVQLYSDISAELVSGNRTANVNWNQVTTASSIYHEIELQTPQANVEIFNQANDAKVYYAIHTVPGATWQIARDTRGQFVTNGALTNTRDPAANGPISPDFYVAGLAVDLGSVQSSSSPVAWTVGVVRDPVVQYTTFLGEVQNRRPYFFTQYSDISSGIDAMTGGYSAALDNAKALDSSILAAANNISPHYAQLVAQGTRQIVGSMDITVGVDSQNKPNASDVQIFVKDVGTSRRANPVEKLYAAWPGYLYLNASFCSAMLRPLLESQDPLTGQAFAAPDLGSNFPVATGARGAPIEQGVEQSGNMLIMMYSHARFSGDGTLLAQHYATAKRWADYLVQNALTPVSQTTADGMSSSNNSNLALKGIIGIQAMAEISRTVGNDADTQTYSNQASTLINAWQSLAVISGNARISATYGDANSWSLGYNLYADLLMGTNLVPSSVRQDQTQYLSGQLNAAPMFGLPIDSASGQTTSMAWLLFTAATLTDNGVRDKLTDGAYARANSNLTRSSFMDHYNDANGAVIDGTAGPSLGGLYSHLALTLQNKSISLTSPSGPGSDPSSSDPNGPKNSNEDSSTPVGAIVGGVVGGIVIIAIAIGAAIYYRRTQNRYERSREDLDGPTAGQVDQPYPVGYSDDPNSATSATTSGYANGQRHGHVPRLNYGTVGTAATAGAADSNWHLVDADTPPRTPPPPPRLTKAQEAGLAPVTYPPRPSPHPSAHDGYRRDSVGESSHDPSVSGSLAPSVAPSNAMSLSMTEVVALRGEVQDLRRVMQEIAVERRMDAPPEYS
ncbi:uncharacterized protein BXZ73DRAFT_41115 [Epithele typhae]|uniref:uncharacterized protein n=1 Tax=Epithele typhae TaxID=378194 RepID=UPI0020071F1F|nr:uncharacterized protein BXZ73DRAFT_41115 [Epithele typhae]KAH9942450.1 hypothetical protein BXZ73DRAFT_41115 [Epithele typhae]